MGYKQPSSGLPFKELGSSPAKQNQLKNVAKGVLDPLGLTDKFDIKGYIKGEQGLIPDIKGKSTVETATKVSKNIQEGIKKGVKRTTPPISRVVKKIKKSKEALKNIWKGKEGTSEAVSDAEGVKNHKGLMKREGRGLKRGLKPVKKGLMKREGRALLKTKSKEALEGLVQGGKMGLKRTMTQKTRMNPPYKKPVGPRAE